MTATVQRGPATTAASSRILSRRRRWRIRKWMAWDALACLHESQCVRYGRTERRARQRAALAMNRRDRKAAAR